jgi:hypothetical protein
MAIQFSIPAGVTPLGIPDQVRPGLQLLASLGPDQIARLLTAVRELKPRLQQLRYLTDLRMTLGPVTDIPTDPIIQSLLSLSANQEATGMSIDSFAAGIAYSPNLVLSDQQRPSLASALTGLLQVSSLRVTGKAWDLLTENERNYALGRIVTDIRPIFEQTGQPTAAVIVHQLRITFADKQGKLDDLYVALDDNDIARLQEVLGRAQAKSQSLQRLLERTPLLTLKQENP